MYVKKTLIKLVAVVGVMLFPIGLSAQTSSINAFSPYTMYGIGEQNTPGTVAMRSMGGAGVAMRSANMINLLNPASYSAIPQKSFLFDFGVEGQNFYNKQTLDGKNKKGVYNTFNFHDIAFRMPLAKKVGFGFSVTPFSSVGYRINFDREYDPHDPVFGNIGPARYQYSGEGDVTEVTFGIGWEIFKNFSIGIAGQYYWGDIDRNYTAVAMPIIPNGNSVVSSISGNDKYSISSMKGQIGVQWNAILNQKRALTFGAAFNFGGNINPSRSSKVKVENMQSAVVRSDSTDLPLVMPRQVTVGVTYQTEKWMFAMDYVFQNWGGQNKGSVQTGAYGPADKKQSFNVAYTNTSILKMGVEYTPSRYDVRRFFKRWSYRAGLRYGTYNQTFNDHKLREYAVSLGVGIPMTRRILSISAIDIGIEYGSRGSNLAKNLGLVSQRYFKIGIGFTLFAGSENGEYWFLRPKYD